MRIDKYEIAKDGENVQVSIVGENKKTNEETFRNVGYTRDFLGGLQMVKRKLSTEACEAEGLNEAIQVLEKQHEDLGKLVQKGCKECLK